MSTYTDELEFQAATLSPLDEGYTEALLALAKTFRPFCERLTVYLQTRGNAGDPASFLKERFRAAQLSPPRNLEKWFLTEWEISEKTAEQLCAALLLTGEERRDFYRRVLLKPLHNMEETRTGIELAAEFWKKITAAAPASTWQSYAKILGLDEEQKVRYAKTRSLAPRLRNSPLLPKEAFLNFPSRQSIDKILRGETKDPEAVRKVLILLAFYTFWEKKPTGTAMDALRCRDRIDAYLAEAGFAPLYAGHPYDWIFLWCAQDDEPLACFWEYMQEVLLEEEI